MQAVSTIRADIPLHGRPPVNQKPISGAHTHRCVRAECRKAYTCGNACDPHGLADSICPRCYEKMMTEGAC